MANTGMSPSRHIAWPQIRCGVRSARSSISSIDIWAGDLTLGPGIEIGMTAVCEESAL